ncbi:hypothetical protein HPK19_11860 [Arthrobacter citreus]|nr:hypothetical protein HPK19_11860 [Arthrobacter citreus]
MSLHEEQISYMRRMVKLPSWSAEPYRIEEFQRKFVITSKGLTGKIGQWFPETKHYRVLFLGANNMVVACDLYCEANEFQTDDMIKFDLGVNIDRVALNVVKISEEISGI